MTKLQSGHHKVAIKIEPSADGDGFDVDASCTCTFPDGRIALSWVWDGWAETPARAANYAAAEWDTHRTDAL